MKILDKILEIINKYDIGVGIDIPNNYKNLYDYLKDNPNDYCLYTTGKDDDYFNNKYREYIPKGWYGFSIGDVIIPWWMDAMDEILEYCISVDKDFEIHQIKLKYGSIRFYVDSLNIEDIGEVSYLIINKMYDQKLIY